MEHSERTISGDQPALRGTGRRKPLRSIAAWVGGLLVVALGVLWIGPPLRPWEDLKPLIIPPLPPGAENGRDFLKHQWNPLPDPPWWGSSEPLPRLYYSIIPWNDADPEMNAAALRGALRLADLRQALAMSGWRLPDYQRVDEQFADRLHLWTALLEISAWIRQSIHHHRMDEAADAMLLLVQASRREVEAASLVSRLSQGLLPGEAMLYSVPPFLAAATAGEDVLCVKLGEACRTDWITREKLKDCLLRDVEFRCRDLLTLPSKERVPEREWPESRSYNIGQGFRRFFLQSRPTVNLFHDTLRAAVPRLLATVPDASASISGLSFPPGIRHYLHPNGEGRYYVSYELLGWQMQDQGFRFLLFHQRAISVRIALHRWQLAKGTLPDKLEELVPDWLPAVPVDPFDGRPIRWISSGGGMLYSVGSAWKDDPANAFPASDRDRGYMNQSSTTPALRLELPTTKPPAMAK